MYTVISANRSSKKANKNWRIYEKKYLEKYFGKVIDVDGEDGISVLNAYKKYQNSIKYIRWYPCPEDITSEEFEGILDQKNVIGDLPYICSSAKGVIYSQCKDKAFEKWKENNIPIPKFFTFLSKDEFISKYEKSDIEFPFLIRLNNGVAGYDSFKVNSKKELDERLPKILDLLSKDVKCIELKCICVELIDAIDKEYNVNHSFRIHVSGNRVISGYGRVSDPNDWVAISGKFSKNIQNAWIEYNLKCERLMNEYEDLIVKSVKSLEQNIQGVDIIFDRNEKPIFLEVQPTYASGYPFFSHPSQPYKRPFFNPYQKELVKFIKKNKSFLAKNCPRYYFNWLDKKNHFHLVYKTLYEDLNVRA